MRLNLWKGMIIVVLDRKVIRIIMFFISNAAQGFYHPPEAPPPPNPPPPPEKPPPPNPPPPNELSPKLLFLLEAEPSIDPRNNAWKNPPRLLPPLAIDESRIIIIKKTKLKGIPDEVLFF